MFYVEILADYLKGKNNFDVTCNLIAEKNYPKDKRFNESPIAKSKFENKIKQVFKEALVAFPSGESQCLDFGHNAHIFIKENENNGILYDLKHIYILRHGKLNIYDLPDRTDSDKNSESHSVNPIEEAV